MQLGDGLLQHAAAPPRLFAQVVGYRNLLGPVLALGPDQRPHAQEIHHSDEPALSPDRQLDHQRGPVQPLADRLDRRVEVGARAVELVDEGDARHAVPIGPPPYRLALRFDPGDTVEDRDRTVEHPQRALHLVGEVDVAGGVDEVDPVTVPGAAHGRGEDGDPTVALLGVEVGDGRPLVHLAPLVGGAGDVEDPFGDGGLAGVDMGEDAQVADVVQLVGVVGVRVGAHSLGPFVRIRKGQRDSRRP